MWSIRKNHDPQAKPCGAFGKIIDILPSSTGNIESIIVAFDNPKAGLDQREEFQSIADRYLGEYCKG